VSSILGPFFHISVIPDHPVFGNGEPNVGWCPKPDRNFACCNCHGTGCTIFLCGRGWWVFLPLYWLHAVFVRVCVSSFCTL
jgi:hypothetical protein